MLRRRRFGDVIARQLDVFAADRDDVFAEIRRRKRLYDAGDRGEAEELYGDYVDAVETGTEALADMRDRFARTLAEAAAEAYEEAFNRAVRRRWPELGLEIENR